jgi:hypothetical protein
MMLTWSLEAKLSPSLVRVRARMDGFERACFPGYLLPVQYKDGVISNHHHVRKVRVTPVSAEGVSDS